MDPIKLNSINKNHPISHTFLKKKIKLDPFRKYSNKKIIKQFPNRHSNPKQILQNPKHNKYPINMS